MSGRSPSDAPWPTFGRDVPGAVWRPSADLLETSRLARFLRSTGSADLAELQARASADPGWFWGAAIDDLGVAWQRPWRTALDASQGPAWCRWWTGGAFNYAETAVDPRASRDPEGPAIAWEGEDGEVRRLTNFELARDVARAAGMFRSLGVVAGDRVGILMPLLPETVVAVLALGKLGAVFTPIFTGYGAAAVATRLRDCEATVLVTTDGFLRRGSVVRLKSVADEAAAAVPSIRTVLVVERLGASRAPVDWDDRRDRRWHEAMSGERVVPLTTAATTDPETPFMIIHTSGTTGRPKGAVHVHGGFPLKGAQDLAHSFDLRAGDALFWLTDLGWMMGPWAISGAMLLGATLVLYEGAPDHPGPDRLWAVAARHGVTHLGLSPTVIRALKPAGADPVRGHDLDRLRVLGSTGEPWDPESWSWFFEVVGRGRLPLINYSGGTEVSGGIVSGNPITPIKPASFSGPQVGTIADVVDPEGRPLRGEVGELVITRPMPGMTRGFWGDPDRYVETYWSRFPGLWVHGDWAIVDADGYWFIRGRSDDTLKVAGKRVGPAEVEGAVMAHPSVAEAIAVGTPHPIKGEAIVIFCVLKPGETDDPDLRASIATCVVGALGKTLRPERVLAVRELPKTRSGKLMRRVARAAYLDGDPGDLSALENPSALLAIREAAQDA